MDARIDLMDEAEHPNLVDLIRRADFTEAVNLFGRLVKLAHSQGTIDGAVAVGHRIAELATPPTPSEPPPFDIEGQIRRLKS